jgi:hypothetical protein
MSSSEMTTPSIPPPQLNTLAENGSEPTDAMKQYCREIGIPEPHRIELADLDKQHDKYVVKMTPAPKLMPTSCGIDFDAGAVLLLTPPKAVKHYHHSIHPHEETVWFIAHFPLHEYVIGRIGVGRCKPINPKHTFPAPLVDFMENPYAAMRISPRESLVDRIDPPSIPSSSSTTKPLGSDEGIITNILPFDPSYVYSPSSILVVGSSGSGTSSPIFHLLAGLKKPFEQAYAWSLNPATREVLASVMPKENIFSSFDEKVFVEKAKAAEIEFGARHSSKFDEGLTAMTHHQFGTSTFIFDGIFAESAARGSKVLQDFWKWSRHTGATSITTASDLSEIPASLRPCFGCVVVAHNGNPHSLQPKNGCFQFFEDNFGIGKRSEYLSAFDRMCTTKDQCLVSVTRGRFQGVYSWKFSHFEQLGAFTLVFGYTGNPPRADDQRLVEKVTISNNVPMSSSSTKDSVDLIEKVVYIRPFNPSFIQLPSSVLIIGEPGSGKTSLMCNLLAAFEKPFKHAYAWSLNSATREFLASIMPKENIFSTFDENVLAEKQALVEKSNFAIGDGNKFGKSKCGNSIFIFDGILTNPSYKNNKVLCQFWALSRHYGITSITTAFAANDISASSRFSFGTVLLTHNWRQQSVRPRNECFQFFENAFGADRRIEFLAAWDQVCTAVDHSMISVRFGGSYGVYYWKYLKIAELDPFTLVEGYQHPILKEAEPSTSSATSTIPSTVVELSTKTSSPDADIVKRHRKIIKLLSSTLLSVAIQVGEEADDPEGDDSIASACTKIYQQLNEFTLSPATFDEGKFARKLRKLREGLDYLLNRNMTSS